jgi:hypothetical protein
MAGQSQRPVICPAKVYLEWEGDIIFRTGHVCLVLFIGSYENSGCSGQPPFASWAKYSFDIGIREFSIFWDAQQQGHHGVIVRGGVLMVHNLGPKFFGGNGGDYYFHHIR